VAGPIGAYIKVAPGKEVFAELAESALGPGLLDRFIVTNDADRRLFQNIRKQAHCQMDCGVFQQHVTPRYNIPAPPDVEGIETVASVLTIQDDLVFNALVDNAKIDQKGLAMDKESSEEKLLERNDSNGKLQIKGGKLREVYFLPRGDYWSVRNGAKTTISNERKFRKTISTDKTAMIEQAKAEVAELKAALAESRKAEGRLESQHTQLQKEWGQAKRKMRDNDSAMAELGDRIDQIKSEMETAANTTIDTTEYEEDVAQQEEQRAALEQQQTRLKEELEAKKPEIETLKTRIDEVTIRNQKIMKDLGEAEEEMTQFLNTQSQRKDALERKRDKVRKYNEVIAAHQSLLDKCCAEEAKAMGEARRLHFTLNYVTGKNQESQRGAGGGNCTGTVTGSQVVTPQRNSGGDGDRDVPTDRDLEAIEPLQTDQNPDYYFSRVNRAQTKLNKERERRQVADEDEAGAYENYQRAKVQYMEKKKEFMELEKRIEDTKEDVNARQNL
jgi:chromosome segregation ATPase